MGSRIGFGIIKEVVRDLEEESWAKRSSEVYKIDDEINELYCEIKDKIYEYGDKRLKELIDEVKKCLGEDIEIHPNSVYCSYTHDTIELSFEIKKYIKVIDIDDKEVRNVLEKIAELKEEKKKIEELHDSYIKELNNWKREAMHKILRKEFAGIPEPPKFEL